MGDGRNQPCARRSIEECCLHHALRLQLHTILCIVWVRSHCLPPRLFEGGGSSSVVLQFYCSSTIVLLEHNAPYTSITVLSHRSGLFKATGRGVHPSPSCARRSIEEFCLLRHALLHTMQPHHTMYSLREILRSFLKGVAWSSSLMMVCDQTTFRYLCCGRTFPSSVFPSNLLISK